jgi:hypothetical protein
MEIIRWCGVALGIFLAFFIGNSAQEYFMIFALFTVMFIAGITFIESFFFGEEGSKISGYGVGSGYQRQSGLHFFAIAVTMLVALGLGWGFYSFLGIYMVLLIFLTMSSLNHLYTGLKEKMVMNTFLRPILTILLWVISLYFIWPAL